MDAEPIGRATTPVGAGLLRCAASSPRFGAQRTARPTFAVMVGRVTPCAPPAFTGKAMRDGKKVYELLPDIDWNKGKAVLWLLRRCNLSAGTHSRFSLAMIARMRTPSARSRNAGSAFSSANNRK